MASFSVTTLTKEVRVCLDMNYSDTALTNLGDPDTLELDELIKSKIVDAARVVTSRAPSHLLDAGKAMSGSIAWPGGKVGFGEGQIKLPDDFLRLLSFKMSDWSTSVADPITEDDPLYLLQSSPLAAVRGNPRRPIVAIVHHTDGLRLEFYSCNTANVAVTKARYIPFPKIVNDSIDLCEKLKAAIVYCAASMASASLGDEAQAKRLMDICESLLTSPHELTDDGNAN